MCGEQGRKDVITSEKLSNHQVNWERAGGELALQSFDFTTLNDEPIHGSIFCTNEDIKEGENIVLVFDGDKYPGHVETIRTNDDGAKILLWSIDK